MVKITNGKEIFEVTRGAFDGIYSHQGYELMDESKKKNTGTRQRGPTDDEVFLSEIVEKPISQWNKDEVKRFASLKEIDISGTKNANEAKDIIKQYLEENDD